MSFFQKRESDQPRLVVEQESRAQPGLRPYGIAEVVRLMRRLPIGENVELVVTVIRNTLESLNVQLPGIIADASAKEKSLESRMEAVNAEIVELTKQIETRRQEITTLDAELTETTTAKERLILAQKVGVLPSAPVPGSIPALPTPQPTPVPHLGLVSAASAPPQGPGPSSLPPPPPKAPITSTPAVLVEID
jgi:hypothetical protein